MEFIGYAGNRFRDLSFSKTFDQVHRIIYQGRNLSTVGIEAGNICDNYPRRIRIVQVAKALPMIDGVYSSVIEPD